MVVPVTHGKMPDVKQRLAEAGVGVKRQNV